MSTKVLAISKALSKDRSARTFDSKRVDRLVDEKVKPFQIAKRLGCNAERRIRLVFIKILHACSILVNASRPREAVAFLCTAR